MPTFTAIALDRLLEAGASRMSTAKNIPDSKLERRNSAPKSTHDSMNGKHHWTRIRPALYATPEPTPLPDSPSSFPPSPYIVNHKRRGPRLLKSFSEQDVASRKGALDENGVDVNENVEKKVALAAEDGNFVVKEVHNSEIDNDITLEVHSHHEERLNGNCNGDHKNGHLANGSAGKNGTVKCLTFNLQQDAEVDDFFDPQDSVCVKSNVDSDNNGGQERTLNTATPIAEFYDAWEELSSENGPQPLSHDVEAELGEIRLSLLMEIEKRKQTEEALNDMKTQWLNIRERLSLLGFMLPEDPIPVAENGQIDNPAEELSQQVYVARFVSDAIGRGMAKAEVEGEMEAQIESKNFEIARLWDRLHYYEAVNREMSQRNQEAVETARYIRQRRKRRQRWLWGSVAAAITLGSGVLAWSYLSTGNRSPSCDKLNQSSASAGE